MPCMCGDLCCWSCGPAQGNSRCNLCGAWATDGCIHIDEETGEPKIEYLVEFALQAKAQAEAEDAMYANWLADEAMYRAYKEGE